MKQRFQLSYGKPFQLGDVEADVDVLSVVNVRWTFERAIRDHYARFLTQPFTLAYSVKSNQLQLSATSSIGIVDCGFFDIEIMPKIPGLETGKCLQLAHRCQFIPMVRHSNTVVEDNLSGLFKLSGIDYFAAAFLSSVRDVLDSGLLSVHGTVDGPDPDFKGLLLVAQHVSRGSSTIEPYTRRAISNCDIAANRTLKAAVVECLEKTDIDEIKGIASSILDELRDVGDMAPEEAPEYEYQSSLVREDYDRALSLARIILEGFDPTRGEEESFTPYFTLDLDQLFESFISYELGHLMKKEHVRLDVLIPVPHDTEPMIRDRNYIPDVVARNAGGEGDPVVVDTKNKYTALVEDGKAQLSNPDLFQMTYYSLALGAKAAVLVYPGDSSTSTKYVIKGSVSERKYEAQRTKTVEKIRSDPATFLKVNLSSGQIDVYQWTVNVTGSLMDTRRSVAELAMFVVDLLKGEI